VDASVVTATNVDSVEASDWKDFYRSLGVSWPAGSSIKYIPSLNKLVVANTLDNLEQFERITSSLAVKPAEPPVSEKTVEAEDPTGPRFKAFGVNPFVDAVKQAFSTFSIDVDTASYTLARNYAMRGWLPPAEAVRTEEFVNFFDYGYKPPVNKTFAVYTECAPSKFGHGLSLLKIGVKGKRLGREEQKPAALLFLIDTSGSMNQPDRLGLVRTSLKLLIDTMDPHDRVAILQYDSHARLVLEYTPVSERQRIRDALDALQCGGSTNLEEGMLRAYELAAAHFVEGAENRVMLLSDGVANLGNVAAEDILKRVEAYRRQGITCSVFGVGMGTYNDEMLEALANKGDGTYAFIDSEAEARRVLVDDLAATLNTIASDVKIQVEFNPRCVKQYRQLGYENRQLKKEDFRNDAIDAGEIGSGQSVTALYELELQGKADGPIGTVRIRYRRADTHQVEELEQKILVSDIRRSFDDADVRFRLAAAVAEYAEILRASPFAEGGSFEEVADVLRPVALDLTLDERVQELLRMVSAAGGLSRGPLDLK
jgi:Ca-activated chloride channel family protein